MEQLLKQTRLFFYLICFALTWVTFFIIMIFTSKWVNIYLRNATFTLVHFSFDNSTYFSKGKHSADWVNGYAGAKLN